MKGSLSIYRSLCLFLIGWFAIQVAEASFTDRAVYQEDSAGGHAVVRPLARHHAVADLQWVQAGEEVSEDELPGWLAEATFVRDFFASFCRMGGDFQPHSACPASANLPLYLLHHCLRIPSHVRALSS